MIREADCAAICLPRPGQGQAARSDNTPDPRFTAKPDELKKEGIKDFQLYYALNTLKRLGGTASAVASAGGRAKKSR